MARTVTATRPVTTTRQSRCHHHEVESLPARRVLTASRHQGCDYDEENVDDEGDDDAVEGAAAGNGIVGENSEGAGANRRQPSRVKFKKRKRLETFAMMQDSADMWEQACGVRQDVREPVRMCGQMRRVKKTMKSKRGVCGKDVKVLVGARMAHVRERIEYEKCTLVVAFNRSKHCQTRRARSAVPTRAAPNNCRTASANIGRSTRLASADARRSSTDAL
jgi:hypothetical protein